MIDDHIQTIGKPHSVYYLKFLKTVYKNPEVTFALPFESINL